MKRITYEIGTPLKNVGLVSIVVPVYNSAQFLHRTLDSLLWQTYPYWEAILVNDGSTDNSLEILQQYAARDSRFKVVSRQNGGHSAARNTGMDLISGKWTAFLDNDDMLYPQFLEISLRVLLNHDVDMVWCKSKYCDENADLDFCDVKYDKYEVFEQPDPFAWYFEGKKPRISLPPWGRIYYTDKLRDLRFVTGFKCMCEDFNFSLQYFDRCSKIACVRNYLITWRQNSGSLSHRKFSYNHVDDHILVATLAQSNFPNCKCKKAMCKRFAEILFEYCCVQPYFLKLENYMDFWNKYSVECKQLIQDGVFYPQRLPLWKRVAAYCFMNRKWSMLRLILNIYKVFRK